MRGRGNRILVGLIVAAICGVVRPASGQVFFEILETPPGGRWADFSLSRDGGTMGCLLGGAVYWWTASSGFRFLDPGSPDLAGVGMAADGTALIAARRTGDGTVPTVWYRDGRSVDLGHLAGDCGRSVYGDWGLDLNADATVAVGQVSDCESEVGFVWEHGEDLRELGDGDVGDSRAVAVSGDGWTVVGYSEHPREGFRRPALWRDGEGPHLILGAGRPGEALNISLDGRTVVGQAELGGLAAQAFVWTEDGGPLGLGSLSGLATDESVASAVADNGRVVGWSGDELWGTQEAFVWTGAFGMRPLAEIVVAGGADLPEGVHLTGALDISGDGTTVVGVGRDHDWNPLYWRLRFGKESVLLASPPSPSDPPRAAANRDSSGVSEADLLDPFPFGKRRY